MCFVCVCVLCEHLNTWNNGQAFNQFDGQNAEWNELLVFGGFFTRQMLDTQYACKPIINTLFGDEFHFMELPIIFRSDNSEKKVINFFILVK